MEYLSTKSCVQFNDETNYSSDTAAKLVPNSCGQKICAQKLHFGKPPVPPPKSPKSTDPNQLSLIKHANLLSLPNDLIQFHL